MRSVLTHLSRSKPSKILLIAVERSEMTFISIHSIANQNSCHDDKSAQQCYIHTYIHTYIFVGLILMLWHRETHINPQRNR